MNEATAVSVVACTSVVARTDISRTVLAVLSQQMSTLFSNTVWCVPHGLFATRHVLSSFDYGMT